MLSAKEVSLLYETVLSTPGMSDVIKISLSISRKNALLLSKIIELGLSSEKSLENELLVAAGAETKESLSKITDDILAKAGLTEMSARLQALPLKG